jgi:hypothetical protein
MKLSKSKSIADFDVIRMLGKGAFGQVLEVIRGKCAPHRDEENDASNLGDGERNAKNVRAQGMMHASQHDEQRVIPSADYGEERNIRPSEP